MMKLDCWDKLQNKSFKNIILQKKNHYAELTFSLNNCSVSKQIKSWKTKINEFKLFLNNI